MPSDLLFGSPTPAFCGRVLELAVAEVVIELRRRPLVRLGSAVRLRAAVERAPDVVLGRPLHVVGDEDVEFAVAIVVEPRGARPEAGVGDAGRFRDVAELAAPFVVEEVIAFERGDVEVVAAVVVVVAGGDAQAVHLDVEPAARGDRGEGAVAVVPVERGERLAALRRPVLAVNQHDVGPAVAVGVEEGASRPERLRQVLVPGAPAVVGEPDAGGLGDVLEDDADGRRGAGAGREQRDAGRRDETDTGSTQLHS